MPYVIARNAGGRPTLQHYTSDYRTSTCGLDITRWSRAYSEVKLREIICRNCDKNMGK